MIEVKGWPDEKLKKRAELFMQEYPEYRYIVVGNKIHCDAIIEWGKRTDLLSRLKKKNRICP